MEYCECKKKAEEILAKMDRKEKIGQVTQIFYTEDNLEEIKEAIRTIHPGSIILCNSMFAGNEAQATVKRDKIDELQKTAINETKNGIPLIFGRDVIHGHKVVFPIPLTMAASFDMECIRDCYDMVREEAVYDGIKWTFAPMIDLCRDPRWGRIIEGPGEDPYLGSLMAKAIVKGFQTDDLSDEEAIAACAKHFVGYGASEGGRDYNHTEISDYLLQNTFLPAFRSAIKAGAATVMSGFNDVNGIPISANKYLLTDVLKNQLGFNGFVISDWDAIRQMMAFSGFAADKKDAARLAINAGIDMDMVDNCYIENLDALLDEGTVSEQQLDEAVLRILTVKIQMGLFEHPICKRNPYNVQKHLAKAQQMAEKSIVLLKNENNVLPLGKSDSIGLSGPFLEDKTELVGSWALDTDYNHVISPLEAIKQKNENITIITHTGNLAHNIMQLRDCDAIVLILGEGRDVNGEAHSLSQPSIPENQLLLAKEAKKLGKPVIGVLCFGRPIVIGENDKLFDALLFAGHGGSCAAQAIGAILFGDAEPEGRLPFTLPYSVGQIPIYYNAQPGARQINGYYNDENPAHRNYLDCTGEPSYPFGFGLSYTEFEYADLKTDAESLGSQELNKGKLFKISVTVQNTGERRGVAVPQLYVRDILASRMRPLRALRAFSKLELMPGESKKAEFSIGYEDLGFFLENGTYIVEPGEFYIYVGENCTAKNQIKISIT